MIVKRIEKIGKLVGLIAVRQGVFLGKNLYNLVYSPFVTIREVIEKRDKSQIFLITVAVISPAAGYTAARLIWDSYWYGRLLRSIGPVFNAVFVLEAAILLYMAYWSYQVYKKRK